jgi:CRISPR type I-D-associated protein Csc2
MENHILAVAFSDVELFSNLEFSQTFYDAFKASNQVKMEDGLSLQDFLDHEKQVIESLTANLNGRLTLIRDDSLKSILSEAKSLNQDEGRMATFLKELNRQAASFVV